MLCLVRRNIRDQQQCRASNNACFAGRKSYWGAFPSNDSLQLESAVQAGAEPAQRAKTTASYPGSKEMSIAATSGREVSAKGMTAEERKVIFASSLGTVF